MSWFDRARAASALAVALALGGCFQPLYGEAAHPGLVEKMREVEAELAQEAEKVLEAETELAQEVEKLREEKGPPPG